MRHWRQGLAAIVVAGLGAGALAPPAGAQVRDVRDGWAGFTFEVGPGVGAMALGGTAHAPAGAFYDDLFGSGTTGLLGARAHFTVVRRNRLALDFGPAAQFDQTTFAGRRATDTFGASYEPDEMRLNRGLVGACLRLQVGAPGGPVRFSVGPQLMFGFAHIGDVDGTFRASPGALPQAAALYDRTTSFAFDFSIRVGMSLRVDEVADVLLTGSVGFMGCGAPDDPSAPGPLAAPDADPISAVQAALMVTFEFRGRQEPSRNRMARP